jgi:hypothetical protein
MSTPFALGINDAIVNSPNWQAGNGGCCKSRLHNPLGDVGRGTHEQGPTSKRARRGR